MKKNLFFLASFFLCLGTKATSFEEKKSLDTLKIEEKKSIIPSEKLNLFDLNALFRGAIVSDNNRNNGKDNLNYLGLEEARLNFQGAVNEDIAYRVRFRLNRTNAPNTLENSSASLDYMYLEYKFGKKRNWKATLGKQYAMLGSYELVIHPIYEYIYSDYLSTSIANVFVMGGKLSFTANPKHTFTLMLHNTTNNTFEQHLKNNNAKANNLEASKTPLGAYLVWNGTFLDKKFQTQWSYNIAQFAQGYLSHTFSLGNQYKTDKQWIYLDLMYSTMEVDFPLIVSTAQSKINGLASGDYLLGKNSVYKTATLRFEQNIFPKWDIVLKGSLDTAGNKELGYNFRKNYTYYVALQHKPLPTQDLCFYLGYIGKKTTYEASLPTEEFNRLSLGLYYTIPILKRK
ncbi:MAG: porin [Capnocytophaga sp.]|nr:porin [Capnocytophaga sp.]